MIRYLAEFKRNQIDFSSRVSQKMQPGVEVNDKHNAVNTRRTKLNNGDPWSTGGAREFTRGSTVTG